jgi:hypothetical protein
MQQLRFVAVPALLVAIGVAGACSVYDESLLGGGGGDSSSSGDGGEPGGDGGSGPTTDASSTAIGSTGNVTTGGGCQTVDDCPGDDTACAVRACTDGVCSIEAEVQGVPVPDQTAGDCVVLVCDGAGGIETANDDQDLPGDDGDDCTVAVCAGGVPGHDEVAEGEPCAQDGGVVCMAGGACVECLTTDQCDGNEQCSDANTCVAPQCNDNSLNGEETDVDCGGPTCAGCALGDTCDTGGDCLSGACSGTCQPSCTDGVLNNGETDEDCGGPSCEQCPLDSACLIDADCDSDQCLSNVCRPRLFFSEYVEGSSSNKAVEIFNYGNVPVDLGGALCSVKLYANGAMAAGTTITLSGTVAEFDVHVLTDDATPDLPIEAFADQKSGNLNFNGNDAVALECKGLTLDVIGQIGDDPGSEWGSGVTSTEDNTLRRQGDIDEGDPNGSDPFDPADEWEGFATDTFGGLGTF